MIEHEFLYQGKIDLRTVPASIVNAYHVAMVEVLRSETLASILTGFLPDRAASILAAVEWLSWITMRRELADLARYLDLAVAKHEYHLSIHLSFRYLSVVSHVGSPRCFSM
jgi:hypothetical protein